MKYFLDLLTATAITLVVCVYLAVIVILALTIGGPILMAIVLIPAVMSGVALSDLLIRIWP